MKAIFKRSITAIILSSAIVMGGSLYAMTLPADPYDAIKAELIQAAVKGNLAKYKEILNRAKKGRTIAIQELQCDNVRDNFGNSPFLWAAWAGSVEMVKYFLEEDNCNISAHDTYYVNNAIHSAAFFNHMPVLNYLRSYDPIAFAKLVVEANNHGRYTLDAPAEKGFLDTVKFLLDTVDENDDFIFLKPAHRAILTSALNGARKNNQKAVADYIQSFMMQRSLPGPVGPGAGTLKGFYGVLQVPYNASPAEIKSAWKRLVIKFHPDKNPNDPTAQDKFRAITEAYEVLSDPNQRAAHDNIIGNR